MRVTLQYQGRTGLLPEHDGIAPLRYDYIRPTAPAYEALMAAGAVLNERGPDEHGATQYRAELDADAQMPRGLVAVRISGTSSIGLRLESEPEFPGESPTLWEQAEMTPCPECGAPPVWYEANYVPGYRVCGRAPHHHLMVEQD